MEKVIILLFRGDRADLNTVQHKNGRILFTEDEKQVWIDDGSDFLPLGKTIVGTHNARTALTTQVAGRFFWETDTKKLFVDNGTAWEQAATLSIDDLEDGTYGKVLADQLDNGKVKQMVAETSGNDITGDQIETHLDATDIHFPLDDTTPRSDATYSSQTIQNKMDSLANSFQRRRSVIDIVDPTQAPPTTNEGDRYILNFDPGTIHPSWGSVTKGHIVQMVSSSWESDGNPEEGWITLVDVSNEHALYVDDGTPVWETVPAYAISHNGLQDLNVGDYQHLTVAQKTEATQYATDSQNGLMTSIDHQKLPSTNQKAALAGTSGTPSDTNRYVTQDDPNLGGGSHAPTHQHNGGDEVAVATPAANAIPKANGDGDLNDWITEIDGGTF
jgi:hypothetical protein